MSLEKYRLKRDFKKTKEPNGTVRNSHNNIFVIQKHQATRLHYDLRLEMNGVLKSWALPKDPPLKPKVKRLAVQTEDHPVDYANFKGVIPKGEYGAGNVEIWDKGTFSIIDKNEKKMIFSIKGEKLAGTYCLIKIGARTNQKNWLFFKKKENE
jgi:DNA ligase D-like protein (predicted 3'-phosphoesterase)